MSPQGSCFSTAPEAVSASGSVVCFLRFPKFAFVDCVLVSIPPPFSLAVTCSLGVALLGETHVKSECRLCPHLLLQRAAVL